MSRCARLLVEQPRAIYYSDVPVCVRLQDPHDKPYKPYRNDPKYIGPAHDALLAQQRSGQLEGVITAPIVRAKAYKLYRADCKKWSKKRTSEKKKQAKLAARAKKRKEADAALLKALGYELGTLVRTLTQVEPRTDPRLRPAWRSQPRSAVVVAVGGPVADGAAGALDAAAAALVVAAALAHPALALPAPALLRFLAQLSIHVVAHDLVP